MLQIDSRELYELLLRNPRTLVIDVRFAHKRAELGYIKNSRYIPLYMSSWAPNPDFVGRSVKLPPVIRRWFSCAAAAIARARSARLLKIMGIVKSII